MTLPDIRTVPDLSGKRVLLRTTLNVPLDGKGEVAGDFRLKRALPTIHFLREQGARVILLGHIGRDPKNTLAPVYEHLKKEMDLTFVSDIVGSKAQEAVAALGDGDVLMLENVRQHEGETTNSESFAKDLASLADMYVNDAFGAMHRIHASVVSVPKCLPSYAGLLVQEEVEVLTKAFDPPEPALFILGGAKFETKEPLIRKFSDLYDTVFVGGALANDFFKAKGFNVGDSMVSETPVHVTDLLKGDTVMLPVDVIVKRGDEVLLLEPHELTAGDIIVDAGPKTVENLGEAIGKASFVLWNGPLGYYEKGFNEQTESLAKRLSTCGKQCIVGGGDTVAAITHLGLIDNYSFVSTGGGAMLEFLLNGTLPGIEALNKQS